MRESESERALDMFPHGTPALTVTFNYTNACMSDLFSTTVHPIDFTLGVCIAHWFVDSRNCGCLDVQFSKSKNMGDQAIDLF